MKFGKTDLIRRLQDVVRKGWTNVHVRDLIESLWRDPYSMRTSGFVTEGGPDASLTVEVTTEGEGEAQTWGITFSIAPVGKKFDFYQFREILSYHKKYESESISFDALEGLHAVYYDFDDDETGSGTWEQVLKHIHNPTDSNLSDLFRWWVPIVFIYFDASNHEIIYLGDNRHGSWWNPWMHHAWHQTFNTMRETGLQLISLVADGDGSSDTHAQFGVSSGSAFHEDIYAESNGAAAPADLPLFYLNGAVPRIYEESINSLAVDGLLCYNGGGAAVAADDGYFVLYHIFFTNCIYNPLISAMGQAQYADVSTASYAVAADVQAVKDWLPHQNLLYIGTLILQTSADFSNTYHARLVTYAFGVNSEKSITGDGSIVNKIHLVNDEASPDPDEYYGTDENGVKGFHPLPVCDCDPVGTVPGVTPDVKFGYLYNGPALTNLAPAGWRVPTLDDWQDLVDYIDSDGGYEDANDAGGKLKETGTTYWNSPNTGATNVYLFNGRAGGVRTESGSFVSKLVSEYFWSSTFNVSGNADAILEYNLASLWCNGSPTSLKGGLSVRWIKTDSTDPGSVTGNDGKIYPTVKIGNQVWTACNIMETKDNTGAAIPGPTFTNSEWAALTTPAYCIYENDAANASTGNRLLHNSTAERQGGNEAESFHHTQQEHADHIYNAELSVDDTGAMPSVDNTNNVVKLTLTRPDTDNNIVLLFGSLSAYKAWHGDEGDLPGSRNSDTIYFVNE